MRQGTGWALVEDRFVSELAPWKESLFTVANQYMGTRGSFEEGLPGETRATFVNGLFVEPKGELPLLGAVPDWTRCLLWFDSEPFTLARPPAGYRRQLDLSNGVLSRTVLWRGAHTGVVRVGFRRLLSMAVPHLAVLEAKVTALSDPVEVTLETGIDAGVPAPSSPAWAPSGAARTGQGDLAMELSSVDDRHRLTVEAEMRGSEPESHVDDATHPRLRYRWRLGPGETATLTKLTTYHSSRDGGPAPRPPGPGHTFDDLVAESARAWAERWRHSRIDVDGDPEAELALRYAAFQLVGSAPREDPGAAIGAKLLSGFGYRHHVFWDTDIFIVPWLSVTHPDLARSHLDYRFNGLAGARRKAAHYSRSGAFYAWESADSGDEVTPEWTTPPAGEEPVRIWTGELEEHIVADVAYAVDHHWNWTADHEHLADRGAEIILDGARYWAGRPQWEGDAAHIRGVIGPDEYHTHVDDSFFTNAMASWHLTTASRIWQQLSETNPDAASRLGATLGITDADLAEWRRTAEGLVLRRAADGLWEQHQGFFELDELDMSLYQPRHRPLYDLLGEARLQRSKVVKQADVVMAIALLGDRLGSPEEQLANFDYYAPLTDHGSSLSPAAHALVAARLGRADQAHQYFARAVAIDMADSMGNGRDGIHAATQGGLLQAVLFGFAGLRLRDGEAIVEPSLPSHWRGLGFSFVHRGVRREEEVRPGS